MLRSGHMGCRREWQDRLREVLGAMVPRPQLNARLSVEVRPLQEDEARRLCSS